MIICHTETKNKNVAGKMKNETGASETEGFIRLIKSI